MLVTLRGFRRVFRQTPPAPALPAATTLDAPASPVFFETTGSLVGQATLRFKKCRYTRRGDAIATYPITSTVVRVSTSEANARAGVFAQSQDVSTAEVTSAFTLSPGTYWSTAVSANENGNSDPSPPYSFTVT